LKHGNSKLKNTEGVLLAQFYPESTLDFSLNLGKIHIKLRIFELKTTSKLAADYFCRHNLRNEINDMKRKLWVLSIFLNFLFLGAIVFALVKIGSPRYLYNLVKHRGSGIVNLKKHRTAHLATLPKMQNKIIMLGNSITAEAEWAELLENPDILNRGIIGDGTGDILNRLDAVIAMQPRQIFLLIGVNDLLYLPLSKTIENYENIVARIRKGTPQTELILESVLPIHNDLRRNGMRNEDIVALNQKIKDIADRNQLIFIDLHVQFKNTEGGLRQEFSMDGIHLNGDGYLLFKDIIKPFVK
jgi:lysophospholipase L1-like esterase